MLLILVFTLALAFDRFVVDTNWSDGSALAKVSLTECILNGSLGWYGKMESVNP